jgi:hypothetical protein
MRPTLHILIAMAASIGAPGLLHAATFVIDPFTLALPPNACLPVSNQQVLFSGPFCDGVSCPPGELIGFCSGAGVADQLAPLGNGIGQRLTGMDEWRGVPPSSLVRIRTDLSRLEFECPSGDCQVPVAVDYFWLADSALVPAIEGVNAVGVELGGEISAQSPLPWYFEMDDYASGGWAFAIGSTSSPGDVVVPFSAFQVFDGFDFSRIDHFAMMLAGACDLSGCVAPAGRGSYTAARLRFEGQAATPARRKTWGSLKAAYR